jgi:hypothetical protein
MPGKHYRAFRSTPKPKGPVLNLAYGQFVETDDRLDRHLYWIESP